MEYKEIVESWNKESDEFNQWDSLGLDEQLKYAFNLRRRSILETDSETVRREYGDPPTVGELIKELEKFDKNLRVFVRPKYHGTLRSYESAPVHLRGIARTVEEGGSSEQLTMLI